MRFNFVKFENGVVLVNTTPHPIIIQDMNGNLLKVPTSELLNAKPIEVPYGDSGLFVTTEFVGSQEGEQLITDIRNEFVKTQDQNDTLVIIGSIIAAQAYPGQVSGMVPVPGYERVAPDQKRMRCDKFTMYPAKEVK